VKRPHEDLQPILRALEIHNRTKMQRELSDIEVLLMVL